MRELNNVEIHATAGGILQRPLAIQVVMNTVSLISGIFVSIYITKTKVINVLLFKTQWNAH